MLPMLPALPGKGPLIVWRQYLKPDDITKHTGKLAKKQHGSQWAVSNIQNLRKVEKNISKLMEISFSDSFL